MKPVSLVLLKISTDIRFISLKKVQPNSLKICILRLICRWWRNIHSCAEAINLNNLVQLFMIEASDFYPLISQIALWMQLDHSFTTQVETEYKKQQRKVNDIFNCGERVRDYSSSFRIRKLYPSLTDLIKLIQCPSSTVTPSTLGLWCAIRHWHNSYNNLFLKVLWYRKGVWPFV